MKLMKTLKPIAALVLTVGLGIGCAEDDSAEEVIQPSETEEPATPPEAASVEEEIAGIGDETGMNLFKASDKLSLTERVKCVK